MKNSHVEILASIGNSYIAHEPGMVKRIQRGGSFMCSDNYCTGYRVAARMKGTSASGTSHAGFRCVKPARPTAVALDE